MENETSRQSDLKPPYISFLTFLNVMETLTEHGVPGQIDSSVLAKFSGGVQRQLYPTLKFMDFIDENERPTELLEKYANTDDVGKKNILKDILKNRFSNQIKILANGISQQVKDSFNYIQLKPSVKDKCITFFLKVAEYSGFEISPHIMKGRRKRIETKKTTTSKRRGRPPKKDKSVPTEVPSPAASDMGRLPISLGINKIWYIEIGKEYNDEDVNQFVQMIKLALLKKLNE